MAITKQAQLEKATPKVEAVEAESTISFEDMIDQYGALAQEVAAIKPDPRVAQLAKLKETIINTASVQLEKDEGAEIEGKEYRGTVGACVKKPREIKDLSAFRDFVGHDVFMKLVKVNLGDIEKYCTPDQVDVILSTEDEYTDRRNLTVKPIN